MQIKPANLADLPAVTSLSEKIWRTHYRGMITAAQIEYMLSQAYSVVSFEREIGNGATLDLLYIENKMIGFAEYMPINETDEMKLQKLYVDPSVQGKGLGSALMEHVITSTRSLGYRNLTLNVNKQNHNAIALYEKHNFRRAASVFVPIGGGYHVDDYIMSRQV